MGMIERTTRAQRDALAYRIWVYATDREWNVSVKDLAELTGESWQRCMGVCRAKGWLSRMRRDSPQVETTGNVGPGMTVGAAGFDDAGWAQW